MLQGAKVASTGVAVDLSTTDFLVQTNTAPTPSAALYVGVSGDVKVDMADSGIGITFKALSVDWHPLAVRKIYKTGTTATDIVYVK